jgi:hypothetical protein
LIATIVRADRVIFAVFGSAVVRLRDAEIFGVKPGIADFGNSLARDLKLLDLVGQSIVGMRNSHPVDFKFSLRHFPVVSCLLSAC